MLNSETVNHKEFDLNLFAANQFKEMLRLRALQIAALTRHGNSPKKLYQNGLEVTGLVVSKRFFPIIESE